MSESCLSLEVAHPRPESGKRRTRLGECLGNDIAMGLVHPDQDGVT